MITSSGIGFFAAFGIAISAPPSLAEVNRVLPSSIELGSWFYKPIFDEESPNHRVNHIVGLAKPGSTSGSNIVVVWYRRPAGDEGEWEAKTWATDSIAEAVKAVKDAIGLPDADDVWWPSATSVEIQAAAGLAELKEYDSGLTVDDPLYGIVATSPDRDPLIEILKSAGWPVADMPFEATGGDHACLKANVLYGMAAVGESLSEVSVTASSATPDDSNFAATAFDAYQAVLADRCGINIPIPWNIPDISPHLIFPPRWMPTEPGGPWDCRSRGDTCWECTRTTTGQWCKTHARVRNNVLQIVVCCCDSSDTNTRVCCGIEGPQEVPDCENPIIDNHTYSPSFGFCIYDNPPCTFPD